MQRMFCRLAVWYLWSNVALADTTCPALREIAHVGHPTYIVRCASGEVEITADEFNTNKGKGGRMQQFCPTEAEYLSAGAPLRWQTASGLPEVCDVFSSVRYRPVRNAAVVSFLHRDGTEEDIDTSVHALVYNGQTLVNFSPPVPGIVVGP